MARRARNIPTPRNEKIAKAQMKPVLTIKERYQAALYIRLSKEDGGKINGNTVENQKALLLDYLSEKSEISLYDIYIDNGYSGTNFERPMFQKMMEDIKAGKVNCIVVKDLSRFGRSYLEVGNYIEKIFPILHIRFIAVTDHFDTCCLKGIDDDFMIPLKNIINEIYAKDISRKICSALELKKKAGYYNGGLAPYGYKKSKINKKLEVDEETAEVVRYIFRLRAEGNSYCGIGKILNEKGIQSPSAYRYEKGMIKDSKKKNVLWKKYAIENMVRDEVYIGNMVRGKTKSALYKGERRHHVPRDEWIIIKDTHEPIISQDLYDCVQTVNMRRNSLISNVETAKQEAAKKEVHDEKV